MSRRFSVQIESDVPNGTAPMIVDSSTLITNLNADLLDGQHGSYYAPLASPTFTGIPAAPTAAADTNTTQIATTAYVVGQNYLKSTTASSTYAALSGATFTGSIIAPAATTSITSIRIPHGTAPTSPTNGDIWTTTSGLFARINSSTVGPFGIGTARTFYQTTAPSSPNIGDVWVDSDEVYTTINPNDYMPKSGGTFTGTITSPTISITTADTATAASHYIVETASDGVIRPKTLANAMTEIVTTAAVNAAAATTVGTIISGTWNAGIIGLTYGGTNANLTAVNGGIVYSTANAFAITSSGTSGQVLTSNGASAPTWQAAASSGFDDFFLGCM